MTVSWTTLLIWSAIITGGLILLSAVWNLLKRFLKIWFVVLILLLGLKLAFDQGWI